MNRRRFEWKLKQRTLLLGERTLILGVLNVAPDASTDGSKYQDPDRAFARAVELEESGADIIDISAESTRPSAKRVSEAEELRRLIPVLKRLKDKLAIPISVATWKSAVAQKALETGAEIINDPSGLTWDPQLAKVASNFDAGLILNHTRGTPETWQKAAPIKDLIPTIAKELDASAHRAILSGVVKQRIVLDPGIGFGKRKEQNYDILAQIPQFATMLDYPLMLGPSRKAFLERGEMIETEFAGAAALTAGILGGIHLVRVHDVKHMKCAIDVAEGIAAARAAHAPPATSVRRAPRPAPPSESTHPRERRFPHGPRR
jgi:dihydropteroate synthase